MEGGYSEIVDSAKEYFVEFYFDSTEFAVENNIDAQLHGMGGMFIAATAEKIAERRGYGKTAGKALGISLALGAGLSKEYADLKTRYSFRLYEAAQWPLGAIMYVALEENEDLHSESDTETTVDIEHPAEYEVDISYDQIIDQKVAEGIYDRVTDD